MPEYKKNHYVPVTYLKRFTDPLKWNNKIHFINSLNLNDNIIRSVSIEDQCQKANLYTLPNNMSTEEKKAIEKAFMGHIDKIYNSAMTNSYDQGKQPKIPDLNSLFWFVIYQSFRTPKFKYHLLSKVKNLKSNIGNKDSDLEEYTYWLGYLLVKISINIFDYSKIEILKTHKGNWFLTSDNPASYWIKNKNKYEFIGTIYGYTDHKDLKIICPINPQVVFILHLNNLNEYNMRNSVKVLHYKRRTINSVELHNINNLICESSDKQIFSVSKSQLEFFQNKINKKE